MNYDIRIPQTFNKYFIGGSTMTEQEMMVMQQHTMALEEHSKALNNFSAVLAEIFAVSGVNGPTIRPLASILNEFIETTSEMNNRSRVTAEIITEAADKIGRGGSDSAAAATKMYQAATIHDEVATAMQRAASANCEAAEMMRRAAYR